MITRNNSPSVALGKAGALEGELFRIGFSWCEAWRVLGDSMRVVVALEATTMRLSIQLMPEPWKEWDSLRDCSVEKGVHFLRLCRLRGMRAC